MFVIMSVEGACMYWGRPMVWPSKDHLEERDPWSYKRKHIK